MQQKYREQWEKSHFMNFAQNGLKCLFNCMFLKNVYNVIFSKTTNTCKYVIDIEVLNLN